MTDIFIQIINMSINAAWLVLAVVIFRLIFISLFVLGNAIIARSIPCPTKGMKLSRIIGESIGSVIFQKISHAVAPSTSAASYKEPDMVCKPERNRRI